MNLKKNDNCTIDVITKDIEELIDSVVTMDPDFDINELSKITVEL